MKVKFLLPIFLFAALHLEAQNVGVNANGATPHPSAALDVAASDKGFLAPRVADTNAVAAPAEGLLIYDLSSKCYRYRNNLKWTVCIEKKDNSLGEGPFNGPEGLYRNAQSCNPFQASKEYDTIVVLVTGTPRTWITRNLGAYAQPTAYEDVSPAARGCLFKYGFATPYFSDLDDASRSTTPFWRPNEAGVAPGNGTWGSVNDPCRQQLGGGWRLPTHLELSAVYASTGASNTNPSPMFTTPLKLHKGVRIMQTGELDFQSGGLTSSTGRLEFTNTQIIYHNHTGATVGSAQDAFPVRCIK